LPNGGYVDAIRNQWRLSDGTPAKVLLTMANPIDSQRVSMFLTKLTEEYETGNVSEALVLFKLDWSVPAQREVLRDCPWVLITNIKFASEEYEVAKNLPSPEDGFPLQVNAIRQIPGQVREDESIGVKRKRRRRADAQTEASFVLAYFGQRKNDFCRFFERYLVPGYNTYSFKKELRTPSKQKLQPLFQDSFGNDMAEDS
jgi:hypothetical protein